MGAIPIETRIFQVAITSLAWILTTEFANASLAFFFEIILVDKNTGENKVAPGNAKMNKINNLKTLKKNIGINVIL